MRYIEFNAYLAHMKSFTFFAYLMFPLAVLAHGGGIDEHGCHSKNQVRHCHGKNAGKYIPEKETTRIKKLHDNTCNSIDGEGRPLRRDLYGKRCNKR
jgi:hypothetical protein